TTPYVLNQHTIPPVPMGTRPQSTFPARAKLWLLTALCVVLLAGLGVAVWLGVHARSGEGRDSGGDGKDKDVARLDGNKDKDQAATKADEKDKGKDAKD